MNWEQKESKPRIEQLRATASYFEPFRPSTQPACGRLLKPGPSPVITRHKLFETPPISTHHQPIRGNDFLFSKRGVRPEKAGFIKVAKVRERDAALSWPRPSSA
jgi:hypothetical protein